MIPRTKVNYGLSGLARAALVRENDDSRRQELLRRLGEQFQTRQILLTGSGRGALYILLSSMPQPRVLVPAYTCKAVVEAARLAGKEVLYGETEDRGFNMTPHALTESLDPQTILIATHQFGIPCDIHCMLEIARARGAFVIEDAAASLGTRIRGQLTGTFGDAAFFSFDSTKLVNAPLKAGFLLVRDIDVFERCKEFMKSTCRGMPILRKFRYILLGAILVLLEQPALYRLFHNLKFQWRGRFTDESAECDPSLGPFYLDAMAEWQADLLLPQINDLEKIIAMRRGLFAEYLRRLGGAKSFDLPPADVDHEWAPIRFPILVRGDKMAFYRRAVRRGIDFAFSFTFVAAPGQFERSHRIAASILDAPFYRKLTNRDLELVVRILKELDTSEAEIF